MPEIEVENPESCSDAFICLVSSALWKQLCIRWWKWPCNDICRKCIVVNIAVSAITVDRTKSRIRHRRLLVFRHSVSTASAVTLSCLPSSCM